MQVIDNKDYEELQELKLTMDKLRKGIPCIVHGIPSVLTAVTKERAIRTTIAVTTNQIEQLIESHAETGIDFCTDGAIICPKELKELINIELTELVDRCKELHDLPYWGGEK